MYVCATLPASLVSSGSPVTVFAGVQRPARAFLGRNPDRHDDAWAVERDTIMIDLRPSKTCGDPLHGRARRTHQTTRAASAVVILSESR